MSEKKFAASKKRLKKARKEGDRIKVVEITTFFYFSALFCLLSYLAENTVFFADAVYSAPKDFHTNIMLLSLDSLVKLSCKTLLFFLLITYLLSLVSELIQLGFCIEWQGIKFKLSGLGIKQWWKKCFVSLEGSSNLIFLKVVFKMLVCVFALFSFYLRTFFQNIDFLFSLDPDLNWGEVFIILQKQFLVEIMFFILFLTSVIAYFAQQQRRKRLRMNLEELKKEVKEEEGDPHIRSMRRELHQQIIFSGLLSGIKKAKVLVVGTR